MIGPSVDSGQMAWADEPPAPPSGRHESQGSGQQVRSAVVCDLADKGPLLCGCQVGLRQEEWLGIGVEPAGRGGRNPCPLSLLLWGWRRLLHEAGSPRAGRWGGEAVGCPRPQGTIRGPRQPGSRAFSSPSPCSREPSGPAVKPVNYSQGLSSPWWAGEGGRAPSPTSGKLDPTQEAVGGGLGPCQ